jgi:hypothetical protein
VIAVHEGPFGNWRVVRTWAVAALAAAALLYGDAAQAQWLKEPTRGIPRRPDGSPDLTAPAPRTPDGKPDLSGLWLMPLHPGYLANIASDLDDDDVQPSAAATFTDRMNALGTGDPATIGCQPFGPRAITGGAMVGRAKLVQTSGLIAVLFETLEYRQIFMDGRELPKNAFPSFMGYSVGRWEGDELVVESTGFKDGTWLDFGGHPHSESLRITERYRRTDFGHMQRQITLLDPKTFKKPITISAPMTLDADTELLEYVCAETPRDQFSISAPETSDVKVAPEILAKYAGTYDMDPANAFGIQTLRVWVADGQLWIDFNGKGRIRLVPQSETMFSPRLLGTYEFVMDARGSVTHLFAHGTEGDYKAVRRTDPAAR